jgi:phosphatidate cytidylyltransferase
MNASKSLRKAKPTAPALPKRPNLSNMAVRIVVGLPLMGFALLCVYLGDWPWAVFMGLSASLALLEFYALAQDRPEMGFTQVGVPATLALFVGVHFGWWGLVAGALAFGLMGGFSLAIGRGATAGQAVRQGLTTVAGLLYVSLPLALTLVLRQALGVGGLMLAITITVSTDTFAYFGGKLWGRTPMAPKISPKKTMEGLTCGLIVGGLCTLIALHLNGILTPASALVALVGPGLAVLGDLWESWLKRVYAVKDSHLPNLNVIPGHGGVLDRADSMLWVAPFLVVYLGLLGFLA